MSVGPYSSYEEVDAACLTNHLFVVSTLGSQVFGIAVQDVDVLLGAVNMVEQVAGHERVV